LAIRISDEIAYVLPMAAFLALTQVGVVWPATYPQTYVAKTVLAAALLIMLRRRYTPIRWNFAWAGVLVGIIGVVQWVGMEKVLLHFFPHYPRPGSEVFNPMRQIAQPQLRYAFLAVRLAGAALVVPFMEELFWRDCLWRTIAAPNDFKLVEVGEWDGSAFIFVTLAFAAVHIQWMTAIVWGAMVAWLLVKTRSLGACIIAHGVTNLLLGVYVLYSRDWYFW
jgi:CAAX prenyl protease-like protein